MQLYRLIFPLLVVIGGVGCAQHSVSVLSSDAEEIQYDQSITGLMKYCSHMATLSGDIYREELNKAFEDYARRENDFSTLRLAISLMNNNAENAATQYKLAENLLARHLDQASPSYLEKDYRPLAQLLLSKNREWQQMNDALASAVIAKERAEKQVEELKSIEMKMNNSGNNVH